MCVNLLTRTNLHYELRVEGAGSESFRDVQLLASGSPGKHLKHEVGSQSCCHCSKSASGVGQCEALITIRVLCCMRALSTYASGPASW